MKKIIITLCLASCAHALYSMHSPHQLKHQELLASYQQQNKNLNTLLDAAFQQLETYEIENAKLKSDNAELTEKYKHACKIRAKHEIDNKKIQQEIVSTLETLKKYGNKSEHRNYTVNNDYESEIRDIKNCIVCAMWRLEMVIKNKEQK